MWKGYSHRARRRKPLYLTCILRSRPLLLVMWPLRCCYIKIKSHALIALRMLVNSLTDSWGCNYIRRPFITKCWNLIIITPVCPVQTRSKLSIINQLEDRRLNSLSQLWLYVCYHILMLHHLEIPTSAEWQRSDSWNDAWLSKSVLWESEGQKVEIWTTSTKRRFVTSCT